MISFTDPAAALHDFITALNARIDSIEARLDILEAVKSPCLPPAYDRHFPYPHDPPCPPASTPIPLPPQRLFCPHCGLKLNKHPPTLCPECNQPTNASTWKTVTLDFSGNSTPEQPE